MVEPTVKKFSYEDIAYTIGPREESLGKMEGYRIDHAINEGGLVQKIHLRVFLVTHDVSSLDEAIRGSCLYGKGEFYAEGELEFHSRPFVLSLYPFIVQLPRKQKTRRVGFYNFTIHRPKYLGSGSVDKYSCGSPVIIWEEGSDSRQLKESISKGIRLKRNDNPNFPAISLEKLIDPIEGPLRRIYLYLKKMTSLNAEFERKVDGFLQL